MADGSGVLRRRERDKGGDDQEEELPRNFCRPYGTGIGGRMRAALAERLLRPILLRYLRREYGTEVEALWRLYFAGTGETQSFAYDDPERFEQARERRRRREQLITESPLLQQLGAGKREEEPAGASEPADDPLARAFAESSATREHQEGILRDNVLEALTAKCGRLLGERDEVIISVERLFRDVDRSMLTPELNYFYANEIPGNVAGGVSESPVTTEERRLSGEIVLTRESAEAGGVPVVRFKTRYRLRVSDSLDFCKDGQPSGGAGTRRERLATVPLSRLEASGRVGAVPIEVEFDLPEMEFAVPPEVVAGCLGEGEP